MSNKAVASDLQILLSEAPPSPDLFGLLPPRRADYFRHLTGHYLHLKHEPVQALDSEFATLASTLDGKYRRDLTTFYKWHTQRSFGSSRAFLVAHAQQHTLSSLRATRDFLRFLAQNEIDPNETSAANWNAYLLGAPSKRTPLYSYYSWKRRHNPAIAKTVDILVTTKKQLEELSPDQHRTAIKELAEREDISPDIRAAGLLLALYGQPASKVVTLTTDKLRRNEENEFFLQLGKTPVLVPHVLGDLLLASQAKGGYASNGAVDANWLMPGRSPGTHLSPQTVSKQLLACIGVPANQLKQSGLRHLARSAPPSIIADTMGYRVSSMERISSLYSQQWSRYPALRSSCD